MFFLLHFTLGEGSCVPKQMPIRLFCVQFTPRQIEVREVPRKHQDRDLSLSKLIWTSNRRRQSGLRPPQNSPTGLRGMGEGQEVVGEPHCLLQGEREARVYFLQGRGPPHKHVATSLVLTRKLVHVYIHSHPLLARPQRSGSSCGVESLNREFSLLQIVLPLLFRPFPFHPGGTSPT